MRQTHIPTESLFEIAEGRDPATSEIGHLQECADCREVLRLLIQQEGGSRKSRKPIEAGHISVARLFRFAQGKDLKDSDLEHLFDCDQCVGVLWICRSEKSLIPVIQIIKGKGLKIE